MVGDILIRVMALAMNPFALIINLIVGIVYAFIETYKDNYDLLKNRL